MRAPTHSEFGFTVAGKRRRSPEFPSVSRFHNILVNRSVLCKHDEGLLLVKVYFKRAAEPLDLKDHERRLERIRRAFQGLEGSHGWPFQVRRQSEIWLRNVVTLICYCQDGGLEMLVFEHLPNGSVCSHLYGTCW